MLPTCIWKPLYGWQHSYAVTSPSTNRDNLPGFAEVSASCYQVQSLLDNGQKIVCDQVEAEQ